MITSLPRGRRARPARPARRASPCTPRGTARRPAGHRNAPPVCASMRVGLGVVGQVRGRVTSACGLTAVRGASSTEYTQGHVHAAAARPAAPAPPAAARRRRSPLWLSLSRSMPSEPVARVYAWSAGCLSVLLCASARACGRRHLSQCMRGAGGIRQAPFQPR